MRNMGDTTTGDLGFTLEKIIPSGDSPLPQYAWEPCVKGARCVVDNTRFGYHIKGNLWGGENMALISAFVGYKMP
jgi:hypothetical protein